MTAKLLFGECDACGKMAVLSVCWPAAAQCETAACYSCLGDDPADYDEAGNISAEIERLRPKAETGEQWAHLAALESRVVELGGRS